ncbi:hypothetical protein G7075_11775 [Phycicoccus sp. HDW14]|uniref:hypothetical protein n=1 Tax=Phycicoccus sp. HDW14 TaxID=2714941 RepID=UPI00140C6844|nr:hypothetical protein [Phycicoccus sp. HDW14]QIM21647.1 hypothetical protein G7075_11775 [Phycicoccus sp. HDW14]
MILGADTDEMRDVQKDCLEAAKVADQVVVFLTALVIVLKAASFWTGARAPRTRPTSRAPSSRG